MNVLSIGGSDPSSGAGIQSDIKTISELGGHCTTVVTAITSQNTSKFLNAHPVPPKIISKQIESVFSDFKIDVIKIGMLYNTEIIRAVYKALRTKQTPIIVDPVIKSTTGGILLQKTALKDFRKFIMPLAYVITPNVEEAEQITNQTIKSKTDLQKCATIMQKDGAKNIIITGMKMNENKIGDYILTNSKQYFIESKKITSKNHGSGCNHSSAISVSIAKKQSILNAAKFAKTFAYNSIKNSKKIGKGMHITNMYSKDDKNKTKLNDAITKFVKKKNNYNLIPECQTNFVYAKQNTKHIKDILGINGRIVKARKNIVVAGNLEYGGSKHVATAVFEVNKKFSKIKSAINIKYDSKKLQTFKKNKMIILSYDRKNEPMKIKNKENSSISWGIKKAISKSKIAPDVIFHKGDFGKEPMILVFGENPQEVLNKIL